MGRRLAVDILDVGNFDLDFTAWLGHVENEAAALVLFRLALGAVHGRAAIIVLVPGFSTLRHQALDRMRMPIERCKMESGLAKVIDGVYLGPAVDQQEHRVHVALGRRHHQRCQSLRHVVVCPRPRTTVSPSASRKRESVQVPPHPGARQHTVWCHFGQGQC